MSRCASVSNTHEWSNTAVMLLCRAGTLRSDVDNKAKLCAKSAAICAALWCANQPAANSIPSGNPSTISPTATIAASSSAVGTNSQRTRCAVCTNNATPSVSTGNPSNRKSHSSCNWSRCREVTSRVRCGARASRVATKLAVASASAPSNNCSRLSSTISSSSSPTAVSNSSVGSPLPVRGIANASATAVGRNRADSTSASGTKRNPFRK